MESFLSDTTQAVLMGAVAIFFGMSWLARAHPRIAWLQAFRLPKVEWSAEQKARQRRISQRIAGLQLIVAGLALPLLYGLSRVMMFEDFETLPMLLVGAGTLACVGFGLRAIVRS